MEYYLHTFDNGIRLVHKPDRSMVAYLGIIICTGSRDELENEHGMAHFIEHMIFKGTKKRKAWHILSRLDDVGGEINAYTNREETCIYSAFLKQDYERAIELIHDICFNSEFPEKEMQKEKNIIIDEIMSYKDNPAELIFDEFEELMFKGNPLGRNILGNKKSLKKFTREDIFNFINCNYSTSEMVISSVGDISFEKLIKLISAYFGAVMPKNRTRTRKSPENYKPEIKKVSKKTHHVHCIIGNIGYNYHDDRRTALHLINNILGGRGMNNRLSMSLREKNGYSYYVESHIVPYSDTGIITICFSCDKDKYEKSLELVFKELKNLREKRLGSLQFSKAKKQVLGHLAINAESRENLMLSMGKSILLFNKFEDLEDIRKKINAVTVNEILSITNEIFLPDHLSVLTYL